MKTYIGLFLSLFTTMAYGGAPNTVPNLELSRYDGRWYELARMPNSFQDKNRPSGQSRCYNTFVDYDILSNGKVRVTNHCERFDDKSRSHIDIARAIARPVAGSGNAKLKVNFTGIEILRCLGIGDGDYWVLGLGAPLQDSSYRWAIVGSPDRQYGWVLSRDTTLPDDEWKEIDATLQLAGYDKWRFINSRR